MHDGMGIETGATVAFRLPVLGLIAKTITLLPGMLAQKSH